MKLFVTFEKEQRLLMKTSVLTTCSHDYVVASSNNVTDLKKRKKERKAELK